MSTVKRRSRLRVQQCPIEQAWDSGNPPPPEAFDAEHHEAVIEAVFFRWAEADGPTYGVDHPHLPGWLEALEAA